jgi:RimJ/RimL family protein N-acetyltransferase
MTSSAWAGRINVVFGNLARGARKALAADRSFIETRPISRDDREALARLFYELSPQSRYQRFFSIKHELTPRELDWLTAVDHVQHEAIVAVDTRDGSLVAVCRYVRDKQRPGVAEIAIAVVDQWQGMGIGTALGQQIVRRARANGMTAVSAVTLPYNRRVHALLRRLGFGRVVGGPGECELCWELPLSPLRAVPSDKR